MSVSASKPAGFLTFTLHAHLPYVVNHGTWPHGIEWLHEAAAETYLPLLRVLGRLERDGLALRCNLNISPILLEQLTHPVFQAEFPRYVERKIVAAREDEAYFTSMGEAHYAETARFWHHFFTEALTDFEALGRDIVSGFRHFNDLGLIEIITCGATHGYMPLLGTDESVRAQVRTAVKTHERHIGRHPRGIWAPECGYRPAGLWNYPVPNADGTPAAPPFQRIGVEQALAESDIDFFFVDTHLVEESARVHSPYTIPGGHIVPRDAEPMTLSNHRRLYQPYYVDGPYDKRHAATIFPRDPRTGIPGLVGRFRLSGRRQLSRLPQEALARRPSLLVGHRCGRRHGRQAPLQPAGRAGARPHACFALRPSRVGGLAAGHERLHPAHPLLALRRRALRPLVV